MSKWKYKDKVWNYDKRKPKKERGISPMSETKSFGRGEVRTSALPELNTIKVILPKEIYLKIHHWCKRVTTEVSGLGVVVWDEVQDAFVVQDAMMIEQSSDDVSAGAAYLNGEAILKASNEYGHIEGFGRFHWHSHGSMGTFWSGDDEALIRTLGKHGWKIAMVFNHKGDHKTAFFQRYMAPWGKAYEIFYKDVETVIEDHVNPELRATWDKAFDDKFTVIERPSISNYAGDYSSYSDLYDAYGYTGNYARGSQMSWDKDIPRVGGRQWSERDVKNYSPIPSVNSSTQLISTDYDSFGLVKIDGEVYYNPLKDSSVRTLKEQIFEVAHMDQEEFKYLSDMDAGLMAFALEHIDEIEKIVGEKK